MKIFCIHHTPLTERKNYLLGSPINGYCRFVETYDHEMTYVKCETEWNKRSIGLYPELPQYRELKHGDIDCFNKHCHALNMISDYHPFGMIIEDDAIISDTFFEDVKKAFKHYDSWDVLFVGGAFHHNIAETIGENEDLYYKGHPASNTTCAYIIKQLPAAKILMYFSLMGYVLPIDFEFNYIMQKLDLKVAHLKNYCVKEGSSIGVYKGSQVR